ncbi:MAG: serine/threonine protein kinase [Deltaproteobacteria bacterium]|nr:serine/threonine protein kinase [Deltaproteobacteria bacterium]
MSAARTATETRTSTRPSTGTSTGTEARRAPDIVAGVVDADKLADEIAATSVDPRLWTGAFATNVWGGRFAVDGVLGEGAQGTTFQGTDLKTGGRVAIKVFDVGRAKDWKAVQLFDREAETLKSVDHPGIPKLLDVIVDEETGARALVRTLVPGESLAAEIKSKGPLAEAALWSVIIDVTDVLGALHGRSSPIVHRDIKPANLIRRPDGKVCLVDFGGVGRMREAAGSTVVGTFGYMAPEQLYGAQTPATDMYAFGATLLMLATGREPEELPRSGLSLDVDQAAPKLSPQLRALVKKLTAPDPSGRPADAKALLAELHAIADAKDRPAVEPSWPEPMVDSPFAARGVEGDFLVGIVGLVFGVLGVVGAVIVGQLLIPLVLTIIAATADGAQKERILAARARVVEAATLAQRSFERSAQHGAKKLESASERERERAEDRRRRRRELKRHWKEEERRLKQLAKDAKRSARRDGRFWV